jgi:DNA ligase-1
MKPRILLVLLLSCLSSLSCLAAGTPQAAPPAPPPLMLATHHRPGVDVADYWVSEKLDGVRGRWDGRRLHTRGGQPVAAPAWFTAGWPRVAMDGELWIGRGRFDQASTLVRTGSPGDPGWRRMRFMVFDLPAHGGSFETRLRRLRALTAAARVAWLQPVPQFRLATEDELQARLRQTVEAGGEGLMLHRRGALYRVGRSDDLLKLKLQDDAEARVVGHAPGKGKYAGMLGALVLRLPDGRQFRLGSGFTDAQRSNPPPLGSLVTYRYNGLTRTGLPRFARFLRLRTDPPPDDPPASDPG